MRSNLLGILNQTGLQQKDPVLYQFLSSLFFNTEEINKAVVDIAAASGGGSTVINNIVQQFLEFGDDSGGGGGDVVPGPIGPTGSAGATGAAGITSIIVIPEDGIDGETIPIPGGLGPTGLTGTTGPQGIPIYIEPDLPEDPLVIPGPIGNTGATGSTGATGQQGIPIYVEPELPDDPITIPGSTGQQGIQGIQGIQGLQGIPIYTEPELPEDPLVIQGPTGPVATMVEFAQDLGTNESSGTFDLTGLSGLTIGSDVIIIQTAQPIASKGNATDEFEMDNIELTGYVINATTIRVYWHAPSVVAGIYNFAFAISPGSISVGSALSLGMQKIEEQSPSGVSSITFSNLGNYTNLTIIYNARSDGAVGADTLGIQFNGDTGANYDRQENRNVAAATSAAESLGQTAAVVAAISGATATADESGVGQITFFDYRGTTFQKRGYISFNWQQSVASGNTFLRSDGFSWRNKAAITSIKLLLTTGNFVAGSKFGLYGIP